MPFAHLQHAVPDELKRSPFSHALIAALQAISPGYNALLGISSNNPSAISQKAPFSQEPIATEGLN